MQCVQTMPAIGVSNSNQFGLVRRVYIVLHVRFKTTRISPLYSCMHGLQTSWSLIQIFESTFILIIIYVSLLHPHTHSSSLCEYIPLTFLSCMHIYICTHTPHSASSASRTHTSPPPHTSPSLCHSGSSLSLTHACMCTNRFPSMCSQVSLAIFPHKPTDLYL
jgi:hypothetical protein